ncbi:MAG: LPS export ABC transporter ATP-binding protein [Armatimonadota bacterium]
MGTHSQIRVEDLVKSYKSRNVVNGVSLDIEQGEIVGLLGPNGAGKTTTFYMIVGLVHPKSGRIYLDGQEITEMPMYQRARHGIGYLPQEASVFRKLTVAENILLVLEMAGMPRAERLARCDELLSELKLEHIRDQRGSALSGGERRRTEIARALAVSPKFILLDEPFTGVDPKAIGDLKNIIVDLKNKGIGIIITDHNVRETFSITDRLYILFDGEIKISGLANDLRDDPVVREYYLGHDFEM